MFSRAVKVFSLHGFDIKVDPSWLLIAALITWTLSQQYFPSVLPGRPDGAYAVMAVVAMLLFFGSLLLHEVAHSTVARRYDVKISGITLFVFGGVAELEAEPPTAGIEFLIAIAGPIMSFALAMGFWFLGSLGQIAGINASVTSVLSYLALVNLVLAIFNLVPAFPLDGGRVLRAYLWGRTGDVLKATEISARSGTIFAYILMALGLLFLFQGQVVTGLWQMFIGVFLLLAARSSYEQQFLRIALKGKDVRSMMSTNLVTADPDMDLATLVNQVMLRQRSSFVPVVEQGVLLGYIDGDIVNRIDRENWSSTSVGDVFVATNDDNCVPPDLAVQELMGRIMQSGQRKFLVADSTHLRGVITLADLMAYLGLLHSLQIDGTHQSNTAHGQ